MQGAQEGRQAGAQAGAALAYRLLSTCVAHQQGDTAAWLAKLPLPLQQADDLQAQQAIEVLLALSAVLSFPVCAVGDVAQSQNVSMSLLLACP